jgi:hypothetical protein
LRDVYKYIVEGLDKGGLEEYIWPEVTVSGLERSHFADLGVLVGLEGLRGGDGKWAVEKIKGVML